MKKIDTISLNTINSNFKAEKADIMNYVTSIIRREELAKVTSNLVSLEEVLTDSYKTKSVSELSESELKTALGSDYAEYCDLIDLKKELELELSSLHTKEDIQALSEVDQLFLLLNARISYKGLKLSESMVPDNLSVAIKDFFANGSMSTIKSDLRTVFNSQFNREGDLFYAMKLKKSDFDESDIRNFLGRLVNPASRKLDKKSKELKSFDYSLKTTKQQTIPVITEFFTVYYVSRELEVVTPQATKKSEKSK